MGLVRLDMYTSIAHFLTVSWKADACDVSCALVFLFSTVSNATCTTSLNICRKQKFGFIYTLKWIWFVAFLAFKSVDKETPVKTSSCNENATSVNPFCAGQRKID